MTNREYEEITSPMRVIERDWDTALTEFCEQFNALVDEFNKVHETGRPFGKTSVALLQQATYDLKMAKEHIEELFN